MQSCLHKLLTVCGYFSRTQFDLLCSNCGKFEIKNASAWIRDGYWYFLLKTYDGEKYYVVDAVKPPWYNLGC